ncbi:MAG: Ig-like domain-containing protein [Muribaculaceae bacterium]|nr:Ig-like domain-containing protein [Muribaculaceae bacterium]
MKKFLLSAIAALTMSFAASADVVTYDFINESYGMTRLSGDTKDYNDDPQAIVNGAITINATGKSRLWADGLRLYTGAKFDAVIKEGKISEIVITYKDKTAAKGVKFSDGQTGTYTVTEAVGTWKGDAETIKFESTITKSNLAISTIKVTYTGGVVDTRKPAGLAFSASTASAVVGQPFTAPTFTKETTATVTFASDNDKVATVDAATGAVTIVAAGEAVISAKSEANNDFLAGAASYKLTVTKAADSKYVKATAIEAGDKVVFVANNKVNKLFNKDYGYMSAEDLPEGTTTSFDGTSDIAFTVAAVEGGFTFTTSEGKMLGAKTGFYTFDTSDDSADNRAWTVTFDAEGVATITNVATSLVVYQDPGFGSFGCYDAKKLATLTNPAKPYIFKIEGKAGISETVAADNAPVEYYNLQGVRVANPENGLYIRRQGNKVSKVLVK